MTDQNSLLSTDFTLNLLSKSSPSQLPPFPMNRSRTQPALPTTTETFPLSTQKQVLNSNGSSSSNSLKPSNLSHVPCKFFKQGTCTAGANCTFSHSADLSSEAAVCKYFIKGNCKFGTKCALLHTMSPYGTNGKGNNSRMMVGTPPSQPSLSFTGRRKTTEQMMSYSSSSNNNGLDHRSFLNDPFASSAPSISFFQQQYPEQLWRNGTQQRMTNDFIGVRSSPRESDPLFGSSPFSRTQSLLSTSMRSNSGYLNNSLSDTSFRRSTSNYMTPGSIGNHSLGNNNDDYFISKQQTNDYDDLNDAMLPSSLNDLFTPTELHHRRVRQQESVEDNSRTIAPPSSLDTRNYRLEPFYSSKSSLQSGYEDSLVEGTAAINIPGGINSSSSGTGSSEGYSQQREDFLQHDDEVQFFMEDDEAVTYDTKDHMNNKPAYTFPSLISLPST